MALDLSNRSLSEKVFQALEDRIELEAKWARFQLQRFCLDRTQVNNIPWPRSSNLRWPLSDTIIEQKKAYYAQLLDASDSFAIFDPLSQANQAFGLGVGRYITQKVKNRTEFEEELLYDIDDLLQKGECYLKITWDRRREAQVFTEIDPLFLITPFSCTKFKETPWFVHVMQFHKDEFITKFQKEGTKNDKGEVIGEVTPQMLEDLYNRSQDGSLSNDKQDTEGREYDREGISRTAKEGKAVVWELHYKDKQGKRRIRTMSPDDPDFNFHDDRSYPYWFQTRFQKDDGSFEEREETEWMVEHCRREYVNKKLHSSRGVPEVVQEGEYSLTSMWRAKHNDMALRNSPVYYAPNGVPGETQNYSLYPGAIAPFQIEVVNQGAPPISWDSEIQQTLKIWEQRVSTPNFGINEQGGKDPRTAKEVSYIQNLNQLNVRQETSTWKKFIRNVMRQAWRREVQFKPKSLTYFVEKELQTLPEAALNDDYEININASADNFNREQLVMQAETLWKNSQNNPFANQAEAYKNLIETVYPSQVNRFFQDPQQAQLKSQEKAASDIAIMVSTGFPMHPQPQDDFYINAVTAFQFLQAKSQTGGLPTQSAQLVTAYLQENRNALRQTNKEAYNKLNQELSQFEVQQQQQQAQAMAQAQAMPRATQAAMATRSQQGLPEQSPQRFDTQGNTSNLALTP